MSTVEVTSDYDLLLDLVKTRASNVRSKSDPIPDESVEKILEVGRWARSGANGQPWEFVVVKNDATKQALFKAYVEENDTFIYWMEQQRDPKLRHLSFSDDGRRGRRTIAPHDRVRTSSRVDPPFSATAGGNGRPCRVRTRSAASKPT